MSDPILIPSTFDGSPMGPTNAVDMVVSSARDPSDSVNMIDVATVAKVAADAAIAKTAAGAATPDASMSLSSPNSNADKRRLSRPKIVAAKSVLLSKPNTERKNKALKRGKEEMLQATKTAKKSQKKIPTKTTHTAAKVAKKSTTTVAKKSSKAAVKESKSVSSPLARKASSSKAITANGTGAQEVFSGVPNEKFEYSWAGWTKKTFRRQSGKTKGSTDSYWYTPHMKYKLRSLTEIRRFHLLMEKHNNDEATAFRAMKGGK